MWWTIGWSSTFVGWGLSKPCYGSDWLIMTFWSEINGECPVILWDNHEGYGYTAANKFPEFLLQQLKKGKEDLDEDQDWED